MEQKTIFGRDCKQFHKILKEDDSTEMPKIKSPSSFVQCNVCVPASQSTGILASDARRRLDDREKSIRRAAIKFHVMWISNRKEQLKCFSPKHIIMHIFMENDFHKLENEKNAIIVSAILSWINPPKSCNGNFIFPTIVSPSTSRQQTWYNSSADKCFAD